MHDPVVKPLVQIDRSISQQAGLNLDSGLGKQFQPCACVPLQFLMPVDALKTTMQVRPPPPPTLQPNPASSAFQNFTCSQGLGLEREAYPR